MMRSWRNGRKTIRNTMKLTPDKLEIKGKNGRYLPVWCLRWTKRPRPIMRLPWENMLVEMTTSRIGFEEEDDHLKVEVEYSLDINYDHVSDCRIVLDVTSKGCAEAGAWEA